MCKKIFVYLMVFYISFLPVQRANAVVPLVVGAAWAIDVAAPVAIRYIASEVAISAVVKAVELSTAYYSATAKISKLNYLKYFKSKALIGSALFIGAIDAVGYYISNDGVVMSEGSIDVPEGDVLPVAGYGWCDGARCGSTITEAAWSIVSGLDYIESIKISPYIYDNSRTDLRTVDFLLANGKEWAGSGRTLTLKPCNYISTSVDSCVDGYTPPTGSPVVIEDSVLEAKILDHIQTLPEDQQSLFFANSDGVFDDALVDDLDADSAPPMPDGTSPIPNIGDTLWSNAHLISTGSAQSNDSSLPTYVAPDDWDNAYYLANTVANGNDYITGLNSGAVTVPDTTVPDAGKDKPISLNGVESRLDTGNSLSESILGEVTKINSTSISIQNSPDSSSASSFWDIKYPDGISGVISKFIDDMKQTPVFDWLNGFVLDLGAGSIPAFDLCFGVIASIDFGCYSLQADAYVWSGIKACMILFSIIVSRRIVFGG